MLLLKRWIVEFLGSLQKRACRRRRRRRRLGLCGGMVVRFWGILDFIFVDCLRLCMGGLWSFSL